MQAPITFTIIGNQENRKGNPIPYVRATQGSKWNDRYQRYTAFKQYVQRAYLFADPHPPFLGEAKRRVVLGGKPIAKESELSKSRVIATIFFGNETHCDPDNVEKGILDALFENDKHVDVQTHHTCRNESPRVEVTILPQ